MKETDIGIYFWGGIFSNFFKCKIIVEGVEFSSSEQLFMYYKAQYFECQDIAENILKSKTPKEAKALGRSIPNFDIDKWNKVSLNYMFQAVSFKFIQNENLKQALLNTADKILVEASPLDTIWGIGKHYDDRDIEDQTTWKGQNLLGKVLMDVRALLKIKEPTHVYKWDINE